MVRYLLLAVMAWPGLLHAQTRSQDRRASERALLAEAVAIPTVVGRGQMPRMTALLRRELRQAGITDVVVKDHDKTQTLIARWPAARPSGAKPILLMAHMDVVEAVRADWQHEPFALRDQDGWYLGRGTSDNKGPMIGVVLALQALRRDGFAPTRDIILLVTGDEESSGNGARRAATEWRSLVDAEYALNADAGGGAVFADGRVDGFALQIAEKAYADFRLVATNRGGHSNSPRPDNAIYQVAGALKAVEAHRFAPMLNDASRAAFEDTARTDGGRTGELIREFLKDPTDRETADLVEAMAPGTTRTRCVATQIAGGHAPNALPQRVTANVNCRIFPGVPAESVRATLQQLAGPDVTVEAADVAPDAAPSPLRVDVTDAYKAALATRFPGVGVTPVMSNGATDGQYLRAAGIPVYGVKPIWGVVGQSIGVHGLDERVWADGFHGQVAIWEAMLRRLAG